MVEGLNSLRIAKCKVGERRKPSLLYCPEACGEEMACASSMQNSTKDDMQDSKNGM